MEMGDNMSELNVKRLNRILTILFYEMKELDDEERDLPIRWSMMHMYSSSQLMKLFAMKRNLDVELAGIIGALHDLAVIKTKKRINHAYEGRRYVEEIILLYNKDLRKHLPEITEDEKKVIIEAVIHHSEKDIKTNNPYVELMKDVDSIDRYLHGIKTEEEYLERLHTLLQELSIK